MPMPTIEELTLADDPQRWSQVGFAVGDGCCVLGEVRLRFVEATDAPGIAGLGAARRRERRAGRAADDPARPAPAGGRRGSVGRAPQRRGRDRPPRRDVARPRSQRRGAAGRRPATAAHPRAADPGGRPAPGVLPPRRGDPRGASRRRTTSSGAGGETRGSSALLGSRAAHAGSGSHRRAARGARGTIRPAVQPGRRIATLRRSAGLAVPLAFISEPFARALTPPASSFAAPAVGARTARPVRPALRVARRPAPRPCAAAAPSPAAPAGRRGRRAAPAARRGER